MIDISQIETQQIKVNKTAFSISELLSTLLYGSTFFFNIPKDEIVADKAETNTPEDKEKRLKQYSKILVAEDDEMNYLFLKNLLEHKGIRNCTCVEWWGSCWDAPEWWWYIIGAYGY